MIEFLCPEGHKIRCPKEKAGRPAKCPRCGVGFRIPTIEELGLGESTVADASLAGEEVTDVPAAPPSPGGSGKQPAPAAPSKERQIEFLCPNGHHLHGPASLQGRAGECPECGSRFRIPIIDEPEAEPNPLPGPTCRPSRKSLPRKRLRLENPPPGAEPEHVQSAEPLDFLAGHGRQRFRAGETGRCLQGWRGRSSICLRARAVRRQAVHPLAALFIELWAARGEGSRVEVHLESGSVLLPDGYLKSHSQQDYAVLVTRDPDGCSTITVVPWNSISQDHHAGGQASAGRSGAVGTSAKLLAFCEKRSCLRRAQFYILSLPLGSRWRAIPTV